MRTGPGLSLFRDWVAGKPGGFPTAYASCAIAGSVALL
jgi:hypothetical protein